MLGSASRYAGVVCWWSVLVECAGGVCWCGVLVECAVIVTPPPSPLSLSPLSLPPPPSTLFPPSPSTLSPPSPLPPSPPFQELYGSPVDYFITCSYNAGSGRLFVLGGDHE